MYFWALIGWILLLHFYLFPLSLFGIEERPYLTKIGRDTMGFKTSLDWPEGGWQKGATMTSLKRGAQREARLRRIQDSAAPLRLRLYVAEEGVLAAGKALRRAMKPAIEEIDRLEAAARAYL